MATLELLPELAANLDIARGLALPVHVATVCRRRIEYVIGRLDQPFRLKLAQEIAGTDQADTHINNRAASVHVAVFEQQERLGFRVTAQEPLQGFDRGLLAKPANRTPFFEAPLLVDADISRNDSDPVEVIIDPLDDLLGARRSMHARRFDIDGVRDAHIDARAEQRIERTRQDQREER